MLPIPRECQHEEMQRQTHIEHKRNQMLCARKKTVLAWVSGMYMMRVV